MVPRIAVLLFVFAAFLNPHLSFATEVAAPEIAAAAPPVLRLQGATGGEPSCVADETTLCLLGARIAARLRWHNHRDDSSGQAFAKPLGERTGAFWFFREDNLELLVKALDGTANNGFYWIFLGSLSDLEFTLEVENTATGEKQTYFNPPGHLYGLADTRALGEDPPQACGTIAGLTCPEGFFCDLHQECGVLDAGGTCQLIPEVCTDEFDPVCGCDGMTYSNDCERRRAKAQLDHEGACAES